MESTEREQFVAGTFKISKKSETKINDCWRLGKDTTREFSGTQKQYSSTKNRCVLVLHHRFSPFNCCLSVVL